jgi:5'(3')-deoxyribonucleotidase
LKIIYIDLDGVIADFKTAIETHPLRNQAPYDIHPDTIPNLFLNLGVIPGAIDAVNKLLGDIRFEVYFLSTAPWNNPTAWTDKRLWLEKFFGEKINRRLILTHRKDLLKGDILIDDRPHNGAANFEGKILKFASLEFPDWNSILKELQKE